MVASSSSVCRSNQHKPHLCFNLANMLVITVSGGFAIVQPNSELSINAIEGYPVEDFSAEAVRSQIAEAQKIAGGSGSEQDIAEAKIELEVRYEIAIIDTWITILTALYRSWRACKPLLNRGVSFEVGTVIGE